MKSSEAYSVGESNGSSSNGCGILSGTVTEDEGRRVDYRGRKLRLERSEESDRSDENRRLSVRRSSEFVLSKVSRQNEKHEEAFEEERLTWGPSKTIRCIPTSCRLSPSVSSSILPN